MPGKFTASFFCSTDSANNQIASFYTGAMAHAAELSFRTAGHVDLAIVSPNDPAAMTQYAEECRTLGIRFIFDPGQQCARMSGPELADGLGGADTVICNDYEFELIQQKTGLDEAGILARAGRLVVTRGEHGSSVIGTSGRVDVPAVTPTRIADPTGVGDAFRGGFMKGLVRGADDMVCARLGSVAAAYALEHLGGMSHSYTWREFADRYARPLRSHPALVHEDPRRRRRHRLAPAARVSRVGTPGRTTTAVDDDGLCRRVEDLSSAAGAVVSDGRGPVAGVREVLRALCGGAVWGSACAGRGATTIQARARVVVPRCRGAGVPRFEGSGVPRFWFTASRTGTPEPRNPRTPEPRNLGTPEPLSSWLIFIAASIPTAITLLVEWSGLSGTSNVVRAVTALPLGTAIAFLIVRVADSRRDPIG